MKKILVLLNAICLLLLSSQNSPAAELLTNGDFEDPFIISSNWDFNEFYSAPETGEVDTVERIGFAAQSGVAGAWLKPFAGGSRLEETEANFNLDGLPAGTVDGLDFLIWQRNAGGTGEPSEGDATEDGNIDGEDLARWRDWYGTKTGLPVNAEIVQTVPGTPGETYSFSGWSRWELGYSGGFETLDPLSPLGEVPSPTETVMKIEFLDASNNVIGSNMLDLRNEQTPFNDWVQHTVTSDPAPAGTTNVRVVAAGYDMVSNGIDGAGPQSAFYDDFSLTAQGDPGTELLDDATLDAVAELAGWDLIEMPEGTNSASIENANFADHTLSDDGDDETVGSGVWLRAFAGGEGGADAVVTQTVPGIAGGEYTFSGWTKWEGNYSGGVDTLASGQPSTTETLFQLEFLDANEEVLDAHTLDLRTVNTNDGMWHQYSIDDRIAPAGTEFVRVSGIANDMFFHEDPQQSAFFDDFSLDGPAPAAITLVPEPSTVSLALFILSLAAGVRPKRRD